MDGMVVMVILRYLISAILTCTIEMLRGEGFSIIGGMRILRCWDVQMT